MGMQFNGLSKLLKDNHQRELKRELKANRRKNGKWEKIPGIYPCPCQCLAIRFIAPRGKQELFRTVKTVKTRLWGIFPIIEEEQIYVIYTNLPMKYGDGIVYQTTRKEIPRSAAILIGAI